METAITILISLSVGATFGFIVCALLSANNIGRNGEA